MQDSTAAQHCSIALLYSTAVTYIVTLTQNLASRPFFLSLFIKKTEHNLVARAILPSAPPRLMPYEPA